MQASNKIEVFHGYDKDAYTYYPVLIVGAGESGLGVGCQLKRLLGFDQFRIFDRQSGMGGTWWINRYPGVACDVPSPFYSFSWDPLYTATELYPSGQVIVKYLHQVAAKFGIQDKVQLNTDVTECVWDEEEQLWTATLSHMAPGTGDFGAKDRFAYIKKHGEGAVYLKKEKVKAKIIISCVGGLVEPKAWPDNIPGAKDFKGDIFHAARWNADVDLTGKDVVVVGTGCSASQIVPTILKPSYNVKSVTQLMKTPPWLVPKAEEPGGKEWFANNAPTLFTYAPFLGWMLREFIAGGAEVDWFTLFRNTRFNVSFRKKFEKKMIDRMKRLTPEKYHEILTPNYSVGCKRRVFDTEWYRCLHSDKVRLTTQKLTRITPTGITVGPERYYPPGAKADAAAEEVKADVIVLANGYETTTWLHPLIVKGRDGRTIHEVWKERGGAQAYLGTAMDGFPNFFMIFGPNIATGHSSVIMQSENGILLAIKMIAPLIRGSARTVEVRKEAEIEYTQQVQRQLHDTVFHAGGCGSWYVDPKTGWNAAVYPRSQIDYWWRCKFPTWRHWTYDYTTSGRVRLLLRRTLSVGVLAAIIISQYRARQTGASLSNVVARSLRQALATVIHGAQTGLQALESRI